MNKKRHYTWESTCDIALRKMFKMVGERYPNPRLTAHKNWYMLHEWTLEKEQEFKKWLIKLIKKRHPLYKYKADFEAGLFLLNWGWKYVR